MVESAPGVRFRPAPLRIRRRINLISGPVGPWKNQIRSEKVVAEERLYSVHSPYFGGRSAQRYSR